VTKATILISFGNLAQQFHQPASRKPRLSLRFGRRRFPFWVPKENFSKLNSRI
jgi:hypothetical protein